MNWQALDAAKQVWDIPRLWRYYRLPGKPGKSCRAPHRQDRNPSFSIYDNGQRFKDFSTGEKGDAIDFLSLVKGCSKGEAIRVMLSLNGRNGDTSLQAIPVQRITRHAKQARSRDVRKGLRQGTKEELQALSELRSIGLEGLLLAQNRGLLRFGEIGDKAFWSLVDLQGRFRQDRMLSGEPVPLSGGGTAKSRTIGKLEGLLGEQSVKEKSFVLMVEGGPDCLAAHHLVAIEGRESDIAAVAILGVGHNPRPEAWQLYRGKVVRIFPHMDRAGITAATNWQTSLKSHAAKVEIFDFKELITELGDPVNDLNDFLCVSVDDWERETSVRYALPENKINQEENHE